MGARQKQYLQEEVQKLIAEGEGPVSAQFKALGRVTSRLKVEMPNDSPHPPNGLPSPPLMTVVIPLSRLKVEMAAEQQALGKKYGGGLAGQASFLAAAMEGMDGEEADGMAPPMVKLGDASIAAPFTSKLPSIRSCVDIVRQVTISRPLFHALL